MNTTHIICSQCKRESFLENWPVFFCPYCGSNEINFAITQNRSGSALTAMGYNKLSEEQKAVVMSTEGINYVEAGPGTAKTTTLVFRTNYLIHYRRDGIHRPLILTFTNQAVDQLVQSFLNQRPQDRPHVATLHGFAFGRLHEFCDLLPYQFQDFRIMCEDDWNSFFNWNRTHNSAVDGNLSDAEIKAIIQQKKRTVPYISDLLVVEDWTDPLLSAVLSYQKDNCMLDFDDLINALVWLLKKNPDVCEKINDRYRYVLVDESQDLTAPELELLNLITLRYRNLFLVGDTDQSIYGWRGAQNRVSDWLESLGCKVHRFSLTLNYRSSQAVLDAAGSVIESAPNREPKQLTAVYPKGVKVMVKECPDPFHEAKIIASSIELSVDPLSQPRPLKYSDIAVLARNHASLRLIRRALIKKKIPVCCDNETPLLQRPVIQSVIRYFRFLDSPNYLTLSALDKPLVPEKFLPEFFSCIENADGHVSEALFSFDEDDDDDEDKLTAHGYWFKRVLDAIDSLLGLKKYSLTVVIETFLDEFEKNNPETEDDIQDFRIFCRKLLKKSGDDLGRFLDLLTFSAQEETELEERQNYVHLLTLHGSKGRQFKKVFIAGVNASIIPSPKGDYEEERRLFYVGITRARKELVISCYRNFFDHTEEPSPFLTRLLESPSVIFCPTVDSKWKRKYRKKK